MINNMRGEQRDCPPAGSGENPEAASRYRVSEMTESPPQHQFGVLWAAMTVYESLS